eukprot:Rhum_TRINITY_DN13383_c0_g1::Rhum_TRINITY_DN13383_c0_g1_i1::g.59616::m.59616
MSQNSPVYEALPQEVCRRYVARREELLKALADTAARRKYASASPHSVESQAESASDEAADEYENAWRPPPSDEAAGRRTRMACPVMSAAEMQKITVWMGDVHADGGADLRRVLAEEGCAVVRDVLSPEEVGLHEALWHNDLLALAAASEDPALSTEAALAAYAKLKENGPGWWPREQLFADPFVPKRGLQHGGYAWAARLHPNVRAAYKLVHGVASEEDLCVGLDNVFFTASSARGSVDNDRYWMHMDQNPTVLPSRPCYQGLLYTWGSEGEDASTTVVWPGSHKAVRDAIATDPVCVQTTGHFVTHMKLTEPLRSRIIQGGLEQARRVPVPAGSLLLFNSYLSHQGWAAGPRLAACVCWEKKEHRRQDALSRKAWMCTTGMPSAHSAVDAKVHTSQQEMITSVTKASASAAFSRMQLPLYPSLPPYGVREEAAEEWQRLVPKLWPSSAKQSAGGAKWTSRLRGILKPQVFDAL